MSVSPDGREYNNYFSSQGCGLEAGFNVTNEGACMWYEGACMWYEGACMWYEGACMWYEGVCGMDKRR